MVGSLLFNLAREAAERHGIRFVPMPAFGTTAQLIYETGTVRHIRRAVLDINLSTPSAFARARAWSLPILKRGGFPVVDFACFNARHEGKAARHKAIAYAEALGFPVVVKTSKQCHAAGIRLVSSGAALPGAIAQVTRLDKDFLVQRALFGAHVSAVVLDGEVVLAYAAGPPVVTGDGRTTVEDLVAAHLDQARAAGWPVTVDVGDPWLDEFLTLSGLTRNSVPGAGSVIPVSMLTGPSGGGPLADATRALPADIRDAAVAVSRYLALRFCRVDFCVLPEAGASGPWVVLDVHHAPDLEPYAGLGSREHEAVARLVERIVLEMGR